MNFEHPNRNAWWAHLVVEELVRLGVTHAFAAPGSRSTPLVLALAARRDLTLTMHFDERGLAFAALGAARATGRPAVILTTSGTAVANLLPAVVEAALDHVPMLVLTADRPAELRDTAANQTVDQVKIFGSYVRWFAELPSPQEPAPAASVLTSVDQAVFRATAAPAGPVHLNVPLREPLAPQPEPLDPAALTRGVERWLAGGNPYTTYATHESHDRPITALTRALARCRRGVIVAAELTTPADQRAVRQLARRWKCPVLADVRSGLRGAPGVLSHGDLILASAKQAAALKPDFVVQVGARLISKRVQEWVIAARPAVYAVLAPQPSRVDPGHAVTHRVVGDLPGACRALARDVGPLIESGWRARWQRADRVVVGQLARAFAAPTGLSEPWVARELAHTLRRDETWVLASSMPVRDAELFARRAPARVLANRGASGIDGTLATACGAHSSGAAVTLLTGDLAFLHDLNSMALAPRRGAPLVVVLINNDGGGIFSLLPVAGFPDHFETCFATPHGLAFAAAAQLFGWRHAAPATPAAFRRALAAARDRRGPTLIEVRTERAANAQLHRDLVSRIAASLDRLA